ncbi:MAG: ABC transporter permease [Clostridia bacterium]|nr:ABC transporter permease [Clostridia bacterium]
MEKKTVNTQKPSALGRVGNVLMIPEVGVLVPILILCVVTTILKPNFLTWKYFSGILMGCIFIGVESIGQAFVQISGEVDLSVGMSGCLSGIMMGVACGWWGWGLVPCLLVALLTCALVGWINGFCTCKLKLDSWITTLATQFICRGLAVTISQGEPMSIKALNTSAFNRARPLGLSWMFFIFIALLVICDVVVRKSKYGYKLRAVGGNQNAAIMGGINADRVKMTAFVLCGMFAAIGGIFDVINKASANSTFGDGREFRTIICVAIGGISAGSGSMLGVGFGIALFHVLWYALRILSVDTNLQLVLIGALLVLSVILDIQRKKMEARRIAR